MQAIEFHVLCSGTRWLALAAQPSLGCEITQGEAHAAELLGGQTFGSALVAVARVPDAHLGAARWFAIGQAPPGAGSVTSSLKPAQVAADQAMSPNATEPA